MGAFATGELSDAQKTEKSEQLKVSSNKTQSNDEILQALVYSWRHKEIITMQLKYTADVQKGVVTDFVNKLSFRLIQSNKKIVVSDIKDIRSVRGRDNGK